MPGRFRWLHLRAFSSETSGNLATMTALSIPVAIALAAFAIDEASLYAERREAQALTDLAAITAAANLHNVVGAVTATLRDNGLLDVSVKDETEVVANAMPTNSIAVVSVVKGHYKPAVGTETWLRFEPGVTPFNGVRVSLRKTGTRVFAASLTGRPTITTQAVASASSQAAFSVGSRLVRIDGGLLNAMLGGLLGTSVSLTVMDYEALIAADVNALSFMDALASELHITGGTYQDVLQSNASIGQMSAAMAAIPGVDARAKAALRTLGTASALSLPLDHLLDLGDFGQLAVGQHPPGLDAAVSLMDLLTAGAAIANGQHQVQLNLGATVPGLASAKLDLAIGEPAQASPWFAIGETGKIARTAQTRALLTLEIGGPGGLLGTSIKLPVYIELAFAEAKLAEIDCSGTKVNKVKVAARPGVAALRIADVGAATLADFRNQPAFSPTRIVQAPLVTVTGQALAEISNTGFTTLTFEKQDIAGRSIKSVSTRDATQSLTQSLLGNLQLNINVAGLGLGTAGLQSTLVGVLNTATPAIDTLLYSVLTALGVRIGEADVRVTGGVCGRSVLVQ